MKRNITIGVMWIVIPLTIATSVVSCVGRAINEYYFPEDPQDSVRNEISGGDSMLGASNWTVTTTVLYQGTRSQTVLGKLKYLDFEVIGTEGHQLETPIGTYIWTGTYDKGYWRGWIKENSFEYPKPKIPVELPLYIQDGLIYTKEKGG